MTATGLSDPQRGLTRSRCGRRWVPLLYALRFTQESVIRKTAVVTGMLFGDWWTTEGVMDECARRSLSRLQPPGGPRAVVGLYCRCGILRESLLPDFRQFQCTVARGASEFRQLCTGARATGSAVCAGFFHTRRNCGRAKLSLFKTTPAPSPGPPRTSARASCNRAVRSNARGEAADVPCRSTSPDQRARAGTG